MSCTLEPFGDRIVVVPIDEEEVSRGGVILPAQAREKPHRGRILALGPEVGASPRLRRPDGSSTPTDPLDLQIDDEVLYSKYGGTELKIDLQDVVLLREADIFGRVKEVAGEDDADAEPARPSRADEGALAAARGPRGSQLPAHA